MTTTDFAGFGLAPTLLAALARAGFTEPTPIQAQAIAPQMAGRDILGVAQTGTGKTAAFGLPILHHLIGLTGRPAPKTCRALILAPTRELAVQIEASLRAFAGGARLSTLLILGGLSRAGQVRAVARGVDVVIATPGRLTDLLDAGEIRLDETRFVVLDEADRMLDMGFIKPVRRIVAALHPRRQSALFSATMPADVAELAGGFLRDPVRVEVTPQATTVERIDQSVELVETSAKRARLLALVTAPEVGRAIVFARTKRGADRVAQNLAKDGSPAEVIHGNKAQNARQRALNAFRLGTVKVLVATDIVARGIDVPGVTHVVNYDLPDEPEAYVHRIGRTGRNGADGVAVTLCAPDEIDKLRAVEKVSRQSLLPALPGEARAARRPQPGRKPAPQAPRKPAAHAARHGADHRPDEARKPAPQPARHGAAPRPDEATRQAANRRRPRRRSPAA
ncbi:DEAD/DEAH box helicase [Amaricoccus sp.]|uniref:DEAD/DEAH box helicase n=1 Tax=Amaricoccus sp. TaxID=1872485 RepID=UPI0025B8EEF4|nr:DEAD/DEAH box helicase [Amaricoccus sp.]